MGDDSTQPCRRSFFPTASEIDLLGLTSTPGVLEFIGLVRGCAVSVIYMLWAIVVFAVPVNDKGSTLSSHTSCIECLATATLPCKSVIFQALVSAAIARHDLQKLFPINNQNPAVPV